MRRAGPRCGGLRRPVHRPPVRPRSEHLGRRGVPPPTITASDDLANRRADRRRSHSRSPSTYSADVRLRRTETRKTPTDPPAPDCAPGPTTAAVCSRSSSSRGEPSEAGPSPLPSAFLPHRPHRPAILHAGECRRARVHPARQSVRPFRPGHDRVRVCSSDRRRSGVLPIAVELRLRRPAYAVAPDRGDRV